MDSAPMAGKHVVDIRLSRAPARASNQSIPAQASKPSNRASAPRTPINRGGSQARIREGKPRELWPSSGDDDEEEDYSHLLLDAYQDDRKGVRVPVFRA